MQSAAEDATAATTEQLKRKLIASEEAWKSCTQEEASEARHQMLAARAALRSHNPKSSDVINALARSKSGSWRHTDLARKASQEFDPPGWDSRSRDFASVYEHLDVLAERFAHLDEATIRRALAQEGGHGGKAAKLLNDERFIMEEAEILENMMSFTGAEKVICLAALDEFGSMDEAVMHLSDGWTPPPATTTNDLPTDLGVDRFPPSFDQKCEISKVLVTVNTHQRPTR